ncbi:MAG: glycosyltransferase family 87 protein [Bacteroidota bacterium]|nr:glycosyltransferase family 87 protein [Bacteroidota bacterium]
MNIVVKVKEISTHSFFRNPKTLRYLWLFILPLAASVKYIRISPNNFIIFRQVFWHTIHRLPLYIPYPAEYHDLNHYGAFFSTVIAPFALPPVWLGLLLWLVGLSTFLYLAVKNLPHANYLFIYWFCANELLTALFMQQFNVAIVACILFSFLFIEKEKDVWSAFFILFGTFVKLYSIVGLAFFFFSKHKIKFIASLVGWSVVFFILPMFISSPGYVMGQYGAWFGDLLAKNDSNLFSFATNISLLGMVRKMSGFATYPDTYLIGAGLLLFMLPYLRIKQYVYLSFRYFILASTLLFVVLFSSGSESSGYIIAFVGVALWYTAAPWKRSKWDVALLVFVFVISSLSPTDIFPRFIRTKLITPYALKALPCTLVWFKLCYEICTRDFSNSKINTDNEATEQTV